MPTSRVLQRVAVLLVVSACSTRPDPGPSAAPVIAEPIPTPTPTRKPKPEAALPHDATSAERTPEQACRAALRAVESELRSLATCTTDAQCGKGVPANGSCGCTMGPAVRLDADTGRYEALLAQTRAYESVPGCQPLLGACVCPEMDGAYCDAGKCRWKPLDPSVLCERLGTAYVGQRVRECPGEPAEACPATLTLKGRRATLVREGETSRGSFHCVDGELRFADGLTGSVRVQATGELNYLDDVFVPKPPR